MPGRPGARQVEWEVEIGIGIEIWGEAVLRFAIPICGYDGGRAAENLLSQIDRRCPYFLPRKAAAPRYTMGTRINWEGAKLNCESRNRKWAKNGVAEKRRRSEAGVHR